MAGTDLLPIDGSFTAVGKLIISPPSIFLKINKN